MLSEAKLKARSVAPRHNIPIFFFLTRSFASRFKLRYAQLFLEILKWTTNWSLSPQGLICQKQHFRKRETNKHEFDIFKMAIFSSISWNVLNTRIIKPFLLSSLPEASLGCLFIWFFNLNEIIISWATGREWLRWISRSWLN